ncbi:uncharacterized protein LOC129730482 [Wyeomyia smithii]|uniref:uncharacterized protein LOC129730482 n=1 Tax=Wyeomyia smithii TaxID=174621 RepID=UPI0024680CB2|nr:uncharacterized protein LOC129730482 [Wyeomyia smithii]XP_055545805.1 uncharacterized protein LOC129730482 [Wyeomyia smithii]
MSVQYVFTLWIMLLVGVQGAPNLCDSLGEIRICNQTEYEDYRECVEEIRSLRVKRQMLCEQSDSSDVQEDESETVGEISIEEDVVTPKVQVIPALESVITVEPIESNDMPDLDPPSLALKSLNRKLIFQANDEDDNLEFSVPTNITTVIRLTNVINNTNVVNVPTQVNSTNVNNIHIYANITEGDGQISNEDKCCTAVSPKSCHASTQGVKCHHKKFRTCGSQCTSDVIHVQRRKRCDPHGDCQEKIAYVPQPEKPTCIYVEQWPFVACGKPANMKVICDGCYDHYGDPGAQHGPIADQCRGCYDDGFDYGPMYRRGPVLRQFYYHEPPCYITGNCPMSYGSDCGYGCYGHSMIDPVWGPPSPYDSSLDNRNTAYFDEKDMQIMNDTEADWGVPVHKCTVVSEDNTISVQNCTNTVDNQYAAAPPNYQTRKSAYKVKQTINKHPVLVDSDNRDSSSGHGFFPNKSDVAFFDDDEGEDNDFD